jgi:hypothetical protein
MSNVKKYRKKPVVIEAMVFTGANANEVDRWINGKEADFSWGTNCDLWEIETLEGTMYAQRGDYIIRGVNGEFYPCKPDVFAKTYEAVEAPRDPQSQES